MAAKQGPGMILGAFLSPVGHHEGAWRYPTSFPDATTSFGPSMDLARTAERGGLHFIFYADAVGIRDLDPLMVAYNSKNDHLEPLSLLPALAAVTEKIGLFATASTTFNEPYHVARKFAAIDHISNGRSGWNIVTSTAPAEAHNFGLADLPDHDERYARAEEFMAVVKGLWDSWAPDAFPRDKESGIYLDLGRFRVLNHEGRYFKVKGPLNVSRPPQGYPVFAQAGASDAGRDFSARHAEVVFIATPQLEAAREFFTDMRARTAAAGRPGLPLVLPGMMPIIGETREAAQAKAHALAEAIHPEIAVTLTGRLMGADLRKYDLDGPLPEDIIQTNAMQSRQKLLIEAARREGLTVRQLCQRTVASRGHWQIVGTGRDVADEMQRWFEAGVCNGFMLLPADLPDGLTDFVDQVVPELRARGLFTHEYDHRTMREALGLDIPEWPGA